ncbi:MAG: single-stranded-DNA-specific exonuclease RecJ [Candidatus Krumholzibacteriota bacterium]|nr:single-stranded-DNA-specific exonuclease RecJ [Candidatus Krumholzibacteriota bacterium]
MQPAPAPAIRLREQPSDAERERLAADLGLHPAVAALAWQRGCRDRAAWEALQDGDARHQHDPALLPDMDRAVDRLLAACDRGERILVHGDYDVDGLTGAALLLRALRALGADPGSIQAFVPRRDRDGYGLSRRALARARERGCTLVVTVDCGSSDGELVAELAAAGVDTIVTDHHLATELPAACAFVSPLRADSRYPHRDLAGSAIAYKLARALHAARGRPLPPETWLDFAALGTVADVMPLRGENRLLVTAGLAEMSRRLTARPGSAADRHPAWRALARTAGIRPGELDARDLAFRLAPRLNAPGRMDSPRLALDLLLSEDAAEAADLAERLESVNNRRRELEASVTAAAREAARARLSGGHRPGVLALASRGWHPGVLGISAARLVEEFGLPVLLAGLDAAGNARGSGRGPEGQDLKALLDAAAAHLRRHGGHRRAVGFDVKPGRWEAFAGCVAEAAAAPPPPQSVLADLALEPETMDRPFLDDLERVGPFGEGNPEPLVLLRGVVPLAAEVLKDTHLRLHFRSPRGGRFRAIAFGQAARLGPRVERGAASDLAVRVARDGFRRMPGEHGVALHLVELQPGAVPA